MGLFQKIIYALLCVMCALFGYYMGGVLYSVLG